MKDPASRDETSATTRESASLSANAGDWTALDVLLDDLLILAPEARAARLDEIARAEPEHARRLREWLAAIAASTGFLEPSVEATGAAPERIGPWRVLSLAGRGGMGEVFLAERADGAFARRVAIKLLRRDVRVDPARLAAERELLARLDHPHIARLLDGGRAPDGRQYLVTEWVEGASLSDWLATRKPELATRIVVFRQLCDAVAAAHANLIVHRDLKPGNVLVDAHDRVKLLDFGIARAVDSHGDAQPTQDHLLTPTFAAPEQLAGAPITTRTDVYALGVLLYLLLTGRTPHALAGLPLRDLVERVCEHDAPLASRATGDGGVPVVSLRGDLDAIAATALAREPERRYASVEAFARDLDAWRAHLPVSVRAPSLVYRGARFLRRHWLGSALVAAVVASLALGAFGIAAQSRVAARERDVARAERDAAQRNADRYATLNSFLVRVFREVGGDDERLTPGEFLTRAATLVESDGPTDIATRVQLLGTIADVQSMRSDPLGAEKAIAAVLATPKGALGNDQQARAQCQMGGARMRLGNIEAAIVDTDRGLALARELTGTSREELVYCLAVRGRLHAVAGEGERAIAMTEEAWRELDALPKESSVQRRRAFVAHSMGDALAGVGRYADALPWYERALALGEAQGEGKSQDTAQTLLALAGSYNSLGRLADARDLYARALPMMERYSGNTANFAIELTNSVNVLNAMEDGAGARARLERALAINDKLGVHEPVTLGHANLELAKASVLLREYPRALEELALADRYFREALGNDHPYVYFPPFARARVYAAQGDNVAVQKELGVVIERFHDDPGMRARAQVLLAELELEGGASGAALTDARDALTLAQSSMPAGHHTLAWTQAIYAAALLTQDAKASTAKARELLDTALPVLRAAFGDKHSKVTRAVAWQRAATE
jgi:eukaryotic-like serine/threonine-protein kinase